MIKSNPFFITSYCQYYFHLVQIDEQDETHCIATQKNTVCHRCNFRFGLEDRLKVQAMMNSL